MDAINKNQIFTGTEGEVWLDDAYCAEVMSLQCKIKKNFEDVQLAKDPTKKKRFISADITGIIKFHKVSSNMLVRESNALKEGKEATYTINSKLENKDTGKSERVAIYGAVIEEFDAANWEGGKLIEEEFPFHADSYEVLEEA